MKIKLIVNICIALVIIACENNKEPQYAIGDGFEIYLTQTPYSYIDSIDYSLINLDTVLLSGNPLLRYSNIIEYDTLTHTLSIGSLNSITFGNHRQMFIVTIDKSSFYCGFFRMCPEPPLILPPPIHWIYIDIPNNTSGNELVIHFDSTDRSDPRLDKRIIDRLKRDKKIE